jgi:hypothetical protein
MYPGGWLPDRLYAPPRRKITKAKLRALKELYEEARDVIPESLQTGLIPAHIRLGRATNALPPPSQVDFDALARSLDTIRVLIAAVQAAEEKRKKREREEETLIALLMEIL